MGPLFLVENLARHVQEQAGRQGIARNPQAAANAHGGRQTAFQVQITGATGVGECDK